MEKKYRESRYLDTDDLNRRIMEMYGLGYFESILYDIEPVGEYRVILKLIVKELPLRSLHIGLRYDNLHKLVAAVKVQMTNIFLPGLRWENELQFAGLRRFTSKVYYPSRTLALPLYPFLGLEYKDISTNIYDGFGNKIARYQDRSTSSGAGLGLLLTKSFNTEISYQYENMDIKPSIAFSDPIMFPHWKDRLRMILATVNIDVLDNVLVPRHGFQIKARYEGSFKTLKSDVHYQLLTVSADIYRTFRHRHTTRLCAYWGRGYSDLPIYKYIYQGGPNTFGGMEYNQLCGSNMSILRFDYRYQHRKDIFFKLIANIAFDLEHRLPDAVFRTNNLWGVGIGVKLLSPVGPIEFIYSRGSKGLMKTREGQNVGYFTFRYRF